MKNTSRCPWAADDKLMIKYHDEEWGVPLHNDRKLFEFLLLEGFQAGLSWRTILHKRKNFRKAFDNFDFNKIAKYDKRKINSLMKDEGIIRNKLKIESAVTNAKAFIQIRKEFGTFDKYIWSFVNYEPINNKFTSIKELPARTELSDKISEDLKKRGFKFVGSTVIYAHMQATGMVNDHLVYCFRYNQIKII
ncbi:Glycosylase [Ignavibacterium album JCM 16511]|uniref:DNA-3-methyladenine glycosylase I n=1 Tax=Ignavibacterium album (strain DSM 19864 / JCM 16511 / NBRC 101810 / Mat9-16) TaxID=945713 RepID=I0AG20_IGNAJ|nr:DNA-3-methyladenine glycosylase I [Ignavibacterium album]AFH47927.1 Glycosylase [Ignavibacterium album JCM 16511]